MTVKRMMQIICMNLRRSASARGRYLREKGIFAAVGEDVRYQVRVITLYPELIKLGTKITISAGVRLVTHDVINTVYNHLPNNQKRLPEKAECIDIRDNVFISANCTIIGNVRIGPNVIVGANSFVDRDLPPGGIYAGTPARRIGSFDAFWEKRENTYYPNVKHNQHITEEEVRKAWEHFESLRSENTESYIEN